MEFVTFTSSRNTDIGTGVIYSKEKFSLRRKDIELFSDGLIYVYHRPNPYRVGEKKEEIEKILFGEKELLTPTSIESYTYKYQVVFQPNQDSCPVNHKDTIESSSKDHERVREEIKLKVEKEFGEDICEVKLKKNGE